MREHEKNGVSYRGNNTIGSLAVEISGKGSFSGEEIFRGTLPCHKLGEIRTLKKEERVNPSPMDLI